MRCRKGQGDRTLLQIAMDVRMTKTGALERSEKTQRSDMGLLMNALTTWEPSEAVRYQRFDMAVQELIVAALVEAGVTSHGGF